MESEKVKEIKEALAQNSGYIPFFNEYEVWDDVSYADILTFINELESENERLSKENYQFKQDLGQCENGYKLELHTARYQMQSANEDLEKAKNRISELEKENAKLNRELDKRDCVDYPCRLIEKEHLKQFAKRLKEKPHIKKIVDEGWIVSYVEICNDIDETLKEMIEDDK